MTGGEVSRRPDDKALPDRVRQLIRAREEDSERLIGWVQLALVATFASLFFLAPRPTDAGMPMFEPVPIALTAYALFTVLRLLLAYRGRLPWWLLVISILVDTGLLMTLIWSFHTQYGQPAAFSLKVPTFIYVFVFIALRGLRFDYRYVLLTGVSVALGWAVMVWAAIKVDGTSVITRNFGTYLTSNSVLLGAEFDKILTVLLVTVLLAVAVIRAQAMLVLATREEAAGREIRRFLSRGVAEVISGADQLVEAGTAVERDAAIIMLDIRGFTRLAATTSPHRLVEILTGFHARIVPLVVEHNGVVDKFMGDGVMITFGAVKPSATAAADALRALDAIMIDAAAWRMEISGNGGVPPLELNGAAVAGPVVFAALGSAERLEFTVIGEAVNLAAKLEKYNKVAGSRALTSAETFERAKRQGYAANGSKPKAIADAQVGGVAASINLIVIA
jgi:adenylate cyclase